MLKSPEEYLSGLSFDLPAPDPEEPLNAAEQVFVEKYMGADALKRMPVLNPEPVPLPQPAPARHEQRPALPEIVVSAPVPAIEVSTPAPHVVISQKTTEQQAPEIVVAPAKSETEETTRQTAAVKTAEITVAKTAAAEETKVEEKTALKESAPEIQAMAVAEKTVEAASTAVSVEAKTASRIEAPQKTVAAERTATPAPAATMATATAATGSGGKLKTEMSLRERMREAAEIQVVSFFVSGQLFLLPVAGIQEVLRYMELVKVPQAPEFVAGAINLRGTVMPLVHLSALLTNSSSWTYDERSFIIVTEATGTGAMQMGLIIDKVSSMHMIPQNKIIWNAESKLGESAEFLSAIVDLDDKVCGMIAPELITQRLFS